MTTSERARGRTDEPRPAGPVGAGDPPPPAVASFLGSGPPYAATRGRATADQVEQDLDALLADAEAKKDEYLELAQRTQADFENFRKRMAAEVQAAAVRGKAQLAQEVVPVLDDLERALQAAGSTRRATPRTGWPTGCCSSSAACGRR